MDFSALFDHFDTIENSFLAQPQKGEEKKSRGFLFLSLQPTKRCNSKYFIEFG